MPHAEVTRLLLDLQDDHDAAFDALLPLVYDELRQIAHRQLRRVGAGETLHTTALVHEAYLRLVDQTQARWNDRAHFFAVSAKAMRHILIDYARRRHAEKRGGGERPIPLEDAPGLPDPHARAAHLLDLDEALVRLEALDARLAQVVELRFFGGMTEPEVGEALGLSERTVRRDWTKARMLLARMLADR